MFKKIAALVLCGAVLFGLTGCGNISSPNSPYNVSRTMLHDIQDCLGNADANSLNDLFAEYLFEGYDYVNTHETQSLLNFIDGTIKSFDKEGISSAGAKTNKDGEYVEYGYNGRFTFVTDKNTQYKVYFSGTAVSVKSPETLGLEKIIIEHLDDEDISYGVGLHYKNGKFERWY